jgi:hypothetical protein
MSPSGVVYLFLAAPHGVDRKPRVAELRNRCLVARGLHKDAVSAIGIATERYGRGKGFCVYTVVVNGLTCMARLPKELRHEGDFSSY